MSQWNIRIWQHKRIIFCIVLTLLQTACLAPVYIDSKGGATAKIRFVSQNSDIGNVIIYKYSSDSCVEGASHIASLSGVARNHNRKRLNMPLGDAIPDQNLTEVLIDSSQPATFVLAHWLPGSICTVNVTFSLRVKHYYEVSHNRDSKKCYVKVNEIALNKNGIYERIPGPPVRKSSNKCIPALYY